MNKFLAVCVYAAAMSLVAAPCSLEGADKPLRRAQDKPNIIFIMADDLGWFDVGYNGAPFYETPNIDRLAADGMIFDRSYTGGANCAPTRACLMTGMYTPRHKIYQPGGKSKAGRNDFPKMRLVTPNRSNKKVGNNEFEAIDSLNPKTPLPAKTHCLAEVLKPCGYKTAMLGKWHLGDSEHQGFDLFSADGTEKPYGKRYGNVDVAETLTDRALQFIEENKSGPFFLYLAHWDVHKPTNARKEVVDKYKKKLQAKEWEQNWDATYAAQIEAVDKSVGRVRAEVKRLGIENDTLIIVTSDNGVLSKFHSGPLRGVKGSFFEGGVRVATAMCWPGVVKAGSRCNTPTTSVDYMPTFAELAGGKLPTTQPVDGRSIMPLMKGEEALADRPIFWHYPLYLSGGVLPIFGTNTLQWRAVPLSMIVKGQWKLIHYYETDSVQLYNIVEDISEKTDLSTSKPEIAQALHEELKNWVSKTKAPVPKTLNKSFSLDGVPKKAGESKGKAVGKDRGKRRKRA